MKLASALDPDANLTLEEAAGCHLFPGGTMTVRSLRAERDRGRLDTWMIGKREYTSLTAIKRMIDRCRAAQKDRASISESAKAETGSGLSSTEDGKLALALAKETARQLMKSSRATSKKPASGRSAKVIPLRSGSRTC